MPYDIDDVKPLLVREICYQFSLVEHPGNLVLMK